MSVREIKSYCSLRETAITLPLTLIVLFFIREPPHDHSDHFPDVRKTIGNRMTGCLAGYFGFINWAKFSSRRTRFTIWLKTTATNSVAF
jgi:hypothetical protein